MINGLLFLLAHLLIQNGGKGRESTRVTLYYSGLECLDEVLAKQTVQVKKKIIIIRLFKGLYIGKCHSAGTSLVEG